MTVEHDGFELDQTSEGLWRCVHSETRIAGLGASPEAAKAACLDSMKIAGVGGEPTVLTEADTTPIEVPRNEHDPTREDG